MLLNTELYPHQAALVEHDYSILSKEKKLMMEWEMGLGKTRMALEYISRLQKEKLIDRVVVICPKSILNTWIKQIQVHTSDCASIPHFKWSSTGASTQKYRNAAGEFIRENKRLRIFLINCEAFQSRALPTYLSTLLKLFITDKTFFILDESSKIKEDSSLRTKQLISLSKKYSNCFKLTMTGLMAPEHPLNIYTQYKFLSFSFWRFKTFWSFRSRYAKLTSEYVAEGRQIEVVDGYRNIKELLATVAPYTSRLRKENALELPDKIHTPMFVTLSSAEKSAYESIRKEFILEMEKGEIVTAASAISRFATLKQLSGGTLKGQSVVERPAKISALISDLEETDNTAVIFCETRAEVELLRKYLSPIGKTCIYSGIQSDKENEEDKRQFEEGESRFFISDTGKGARGINLQGNCSLMYFYSLTSSTDEYIQAQDRIHRVGQKNNCTYKYLLSEDTVDIPIYRLIRDKESLAIAFSTGRISF